MQAITNLGRFLARTPLVTALVTAIVVLGGGIVVFAATGGDGAGATEVFLEPADQVGANPFLDLLRGPVPSVVLARDLLPPAKANATPSLSGQTVGLYGGTLNNANCDREQMITFLTGNVGEGQAWASVQGITLNQLPAYIRSLTPVQLRLDTRVTNHGYRDGAATPLQSVLQAGTAVLIDHNGVPRARCACGNPLLAPEAATKPSYVGAPWDGFDPAVLVRVSPSPTEQTVFVLHDAATGKLFDRPAGTAGEADKPHIGAAPKPPATTTTTAKGVTAPTGVTTTAVGVTTTTAATTSTAPTTAQAGRGQNTTTTTAGRGAGTTVAPATVAPITQPPVTQPPVTEPPVTQPPITEPPTTSTAPTTTTTTVAKVKVPTLTDRDEASAQAIAKRSGLATSSTVVERAGIKPGTVIAQDPAPGAEVAPGSTVGLTVAKAPTVPQLVGLTIGDATRAGKNAGLNVVGDASRTQKLACNETQVTDQKPAAGAPIPANGTVTVNYLLGLCLG